MKPPPFGYAAPTTVEEVLDLLATHADDEPRVLAGGQSLVPLMNFRLAQPRFLVDLRRVDALTKIRTDSEYLVMGAMLRQSDLERSPEVALAAPLLAEAVGFVAHPPIRNRGTIGGSLAHADPAAELPAVALALDAELVAAGPAGTRTIPASEFFLGPLTSALGPDEVLTEIRLPRRQHVGGHAFVEFARTHGNFAVVGVAVVVELDGDTVARASIALSGMASTPVRAAAAERTLVGSSADAATIGAAVDAAVAELSPSGDLHAGAETRRELAATYLRRGIELAITRAKERR